MWAYRTTFKTLYGETPFALTYGSEAVVPIEVGMPRVQHSNKDSNDKRLEEHIKFLEERMEEAEAQTGANKMKAEHYFNKSVKPRSLKVGDFVLKEAWTTTQGE